MWWAIIRGLTERQTIVLTDDSVQVGKRRPLLSEHYVIPWSEVESVRTELANGGRPLGFGAFVARTMAGKAASWAGVPFLAITQSDGTKLAVSEYVSELEREWTEELLNCALRVYGREGRS